MKKYLKYPFLILAVSIVAVEIIFFIFIFKKLLAIEAVTSVPWIIISLLLLPVLIIGVTIFRFMGIYTSFWKNLNKNQHGSSTFVEQKILETQYLKVPKYGSFKGQGGFVVGWDESKENMLVDSSPTSTLVLAISRGGKGEIEILPTIDNLSRGSEKPSMVIFDKKPELYNLMGENLQKEGYDVKVLNLKDLSKSMLYNPLQLVIEYYLGKEESKVDKNKSKSELELMSVAENLIPQPKNKNDIWTTTARLLFRAGVLALLEECENKRLLRQEVTLYAVYTLLSELSAIEKEDKTGLNTFFDSKDHYSLARKTFNSINLPPGNTWNSIKLSALPKMETFGIEDLARVTSGNDVDLLDFGYGEKPIALFITFPTMNEIIEGIASMYIDQLFTRLDEYTEKTGGEMERKLYFILDEIASVRKIDTIGRILSTGLGKGFRTMVVLQDPDQLKKQYSPAQAEEILKNCSNQIYLLLDNQKFNEEFSKSIGEYTVEETTKSGTYGSAKSFTNSYRSRRLIRADELKMLELGEAIISRVNYRKDFKGNPIKAHPIANIGENKMLLRHQYLELEFKSIDDLENVIGDQNKIKLKIVIDKIMLIVNEVDQRMEEKSNENMDEYNKVYEEEFQNEIVAEYNELNRSETINEIKLILKKIAKKYMILELAKINYDTEDEIMVGVDFLVKKMEKSEALRKDKLIKSLELLLNSI